MVEAQEMAEPAGSRGGRGLPAAALTEVPGARTSCALLTVLTVMLAFLTSEPRMDAVVRPLYFAVLFAFFYQIGLRYPHIRVLPLRLLELGFLVLTMGFAGGAVILLAGGDVEYPVLAHLRTTLERGAGFLLGLSLISYGTILWIPHLLESHRALHVRFRRTRGQLAVSEWARSRMEMRFVEAERLGAVGELAAGVAHDLRNPLAIVKATAESLRRRPRDPAEMREHTEVICRNIEKADRTISALIDLGKPRDPEPSAIALEDLVKEVLGLLPLECKRRSITFETDCAPGVIVHSDPRMLVQLLLNLALNAVQASEEGSTITVITRWFQLGSEPFAALVVADRGCGITPEQRSRLFTPFFTTKAEGTGLGLLSARRIADELGGRVGLAPRHSGGARAVLLLPSHRATSARKSTATANREVRP